jgi:hypothetical protein
LPRFSFFFIAARLAAARSSGVIADDCMQPISDFADNISKGGMLKQNKNARCGLLHPRLKFNS